MLSSSLRSGRTPSGGQMVSWSMKRVSAMAGVALRDKVADEELLVHFADEAWPGLVVRDFIADDVVAFL